MGDERVLVKVTHSRGIAAVYESEGEYWLAGELGLGGTGLSGYRAGLEGLGDEGTVHGGLVPAGAVSVEVVDDAGARHEATVANGAWVIVLDQPTEGSTIPVGFTDADGHFVTPPLPSDWPRSPVEDAQERCPVCGQCEWDEVQPQDDSRGMVGHPVKGAELDPGPVGPNGMDWDNLRWEPSPFVTCRICGHEEGGGAVIRAFAREGPPTEEDLAEAQRLEAERRAQARAALAGVRFPVYAPANRPIRLGGWSGGAPGAFAPPDAAATPTTAVTVTSDLREDRIPGLSVESETSDEYFGDELSSLREALEDVVEDYAPPRDELSDAALKLWFSGRERRGKRLAWMATTRRRQFLVDGQSREFLFAELDGRWAAIRRDRELQITISSRDVDAEAVRLERLDNLDVLEIPAWGVS